MFGCCWLFFDYECLVVGGVGLLVLVVSGWFWFVSGWWLIMVLMVFVALEGIWRCCNYV